MLVFPTIKAPAYPLKEIFTDHTIKGETDSITILTRPRFTKTPVSFELSWSKLSATDFNKLRSFYRKDTKGGALIFNWTYPFNEPNNDFSGQTFQVRFDGDLEFQLVDFGYYSGTITLTEA